MRKKREKFLDKYTTYEYASKSKSNFLKALGIGAISDIIKSIGLVVIMYIVAILPGVLIMVYCYTH